MHRVHHSIRPEETNSNFGFNLPWWDRLLGTYRVQPRDGHEAMTIGIEQFRSRGDLRLDRMLVQPRSEEHTSELQSLMRISYAVFCLKKKKETKHTTHEQ